MRNTGTWILSLAALALGWGCSTIPPEYDFPEARPLGREFATPISRPEPLGETPKGPAGTLTLRDALSFALLHSPSLSAYSLEIRAAEARALQAGLLPNPEFEVEVEEVGGSGDRRGFRGAETTLQLGQLIELGGKPSKRRHVAALQTAGAAWDYETKRLDVLTEVTAAFVEVLAAQERVKAASELVQLSKDVLAAVSERVSAGKDSPIERIKAEVALSSVRMQLTEERGRLEAARKRLAAQWGATEVSFREVTGPFDVVAAVPPVEKLVPFLARNPDLARWEAEIEKRRAALALEEARIIPDLTLFGGVRHYNETDDAAFVFGFGIPIPVFNRNQGAVRAAEFDIAKAEYERRAAEAGVYSDLAGKYRDFSNAFSRIESLKKEVLPGAREAFEATRKGYREGKVDYLAVLDAQRTLFEARSQYVSALSEYHKARAEVERLIGQAIGSETDTK